MARTLVENARPRKTLTVFGRVLASKVSSKHGRPGRMWLDEAQLASESVQRLIASQRLIIVEVVASADDEPTAVVSGTVPMPEVAPVQVPVAVAVEEAVAFQVDAEAETTPEPAPEPTADPVESTPVFTQEALEDLTLPELKALLTSGSLSTKGNKGDLVARLLASQEAEPVGQ